MTEKDIVDIQAEAAKMNPDRTRAAVIMQMTHGGNIHVRTSGSVGDKAIMLKVLDVQVSKDFLQPTKGAPDGQVKEDDQEAFEKSQDEVK